MTLSELLSTPAPFERFKNVSVIWIKGGANAPLFCSWLEHRIVEFFDTTAHHVQTRLVSEQNLQALLSMSFLGDGQWYILKDSSELAKTQQKKLYQYLSQYDGPHRIICVVDDDYDIPPSVLHIDLNDEVKHPTFIKMASCINGALPSDPLFVKRLFDVCKSISLDVGFMLAYYAQLLGRKHDVFFNTWFERIVVPEQSLFTLSQFFFAKDMKNFLIIWSRMAEVYPEEFWVAYWSEQLWQANVFLNMDSSGIAAIREPSGKKLVNRLPFSFTQKDWKMYTSNELVRAHSFLYTVDYQQKNGAASCGVDLFCFKFMVHHFKQSRAT